MEIVCGGEATVLELVEPGRRPIEEPKKCPSCEAPTTRTLRGKEGACTYCTNPKCAAAVFAKLDCWIGSSKKGVGILDIGDAMIKSLWDNGMLSDPADLYTLTAEQIKNVQIGKGVRIGTSRAEKVVANVQGKKKLALHTFLGSLGIELLGRRRVVLLKGTAGGKLDRLEQWLDLDNLRTLEMPGYGDAIRAAVVQGIEDNLPLINKLLANGVQIDYSADEVEADKPTEPTGDKPFAGLSFCFTGTRDGEDEVAAMGGTLKSGVSKGLDFLVQKDATSSSNKTKKAEELGTQVIGIEYLRRAIKGEVILKKATPVQV